MFEIKICNDNYDRTKNDDINGWNEKNVKYIYKKIIEKKTYIGC
jgi:hypothetical protein